MGTYLLKTKDVIVGRKQNIFLKPATKLFLQMAFLYSEMLSLHKIKIIHVTHSVLDKTMRHVNYPPVNVIFTERNVLFFNKHP